jgi:hypothetical protein
LVASQAADSQTQGISRRPLLFRVGLNAQEFKARRQTSSSQTHKDIGLLGCSPRRDLGFMVLGSRLVQGHAGGLPLILLGHLLGKNLLMTGLMLCG